MPVEMQVVVIQTELKIKRTAVQVLQKLFVHSRIHTNGKISRDEYNLNWGRLATKKKRHERRKE